MEDYCEDDEEDEEDCLEEEPGFYQVAADLALVVVGAGVYYFPNALDDDDFADSVGGEEGC